MPQNDGFTLAETLITLVIIGVIAAITVPTLIAKSKEQEIVTKVVKIYSTISQAHSRAKMDYALISEVDDGKDAATILANHFKPYLSISKDCGFEPGCFPDVNYKTFDGRTTINFLTNPSRYMYNLNDGSVIAFIGYASEYLSTFNSYGAIYYDVNGHKGPNKFGVDMFQFNINKNGIINYNMNHINSGADFLDNCLTDGFECSAWIITFKNIDYMHSSEAELRAKYNIIKPEEEEEEEEEG